MSNKFAYVLFLVGALTGTVRCFSFCEIDSIGANSSPIQPNKVACKQTKSVLVA